MTHYPSHQPDRTDLAPVRPAEAIAELIALAALSVTGVYELHSGSFGEVATYLPGRRVEGVRIRDDHVEVHLVLVWGFPVLETAERVRAVVSPIAGRRVDVAVQDVIDLALLPSTPSSTSVTSSGLPATPVMPAVPPAVNTPATNENRER